MREGGISRSFHRGFTLMEVLIVLAIIIILILLALLNIRNQINRGFDSRRKADLALIRTAFEDYNNDTQSYPDNNSILEDCGGDSMVPYLSKVPCDPVTREGYLYVIPAGGPTTGYVICTALQDKGDPDITRLGCGGPAACGYGPDYNYCLAQGILMQGPGYIPPTIGPTPSPMPTQGAGEIYACVQSVDINGNPIGVCNNVGYPRPNCPRYYSVDPCNNECSDPSTWCL